MEFISKRYQHHLKNMMVENKEGHVYSRPSLVKASIQFLTLLHVPNEGLYKAMVCAAVHRYVYVKSMSTKALLSVRICEAVVYHSLSLRYTSEQNVQCISC